MTNRVFSELPSKPDQLNEAMCGPYNRTGLLCGRCIDGYGPVVYSLDMKCADCSRLSEGFAISLYLFLEFFPITVLFFIVVIFRLDITGGPMLGYVLFCQAFMLVVQHSTYLYQYILSNISPPLQVLFYITLALCDSWTLHFFRFLIHSFCISKKTDRHSRSHAQSTNSYLSSFACSHYMHCHGVTRKRLQIDSICLETF